MEVKERLLQLGINVTEADEEAILFAENKTCEHIKNVCNIDYIPGELEYMAIDMACAQFLKDRQLSGMLESFDARGALKAITEGDVSVEYDADAEKSALDNLLDLLNRGEADLYRFRKICW